MRSATTDDAVRWSLCPTWKSSNKLHTAKNESCDHEKADTYADRHPLHALLAVANQDVLSTQSHSACMQAANFAVAL